MAKELDKNLSLREVVNKKTGKVLHIVMALGSPNGSGKQYNYEVVVYDRNKRSVDYKFFSKTGLIKTFYWHKRLDGYASNILKEITRLIISNLFINGNEVFSTENGGIRYLTRYFNTKFQELLNDFR